MNSIGVVPPKQQQQTKFNLEMIDGDKLVEDMENHTEPLLVFTVVTKIISPTLISIWKMPINIM